MTDERVKRVLAEEVGTSGRGRLRIYLGAAPGVGKTYAMLNEGHRRAARSTDVVIGLVETHGRAQTRAMIGPLEVIPRRSIEYRGVNFEEMDVDAIIARRPVLALIDELAHTNVPGARNAKRWQDIQEILDAGIDVISTVNIQHLESLNDVVESITGIKQRETVPDAVVRAADQIELVDMSAEALRRRMAHGNIYAAEKVDAALGNYFRAGNLAALRELALLWVADRVEEGLERYRKDHTIADTWAARTRIVVALETARGGETLLRRGAVIAGRSAGRDLVAVHIVRSDGSLEPTAETMTRLRALTEELGGTFHTVVGDDVTQALLDFTRSVNGTQVVIGTTMRSRLSIFLKPSTSDTIARAAHDIDVHVVTLEDEPRGRRNDDRHRHGLPAGWPRWLVALAVPALLTLGLKPLSQSLSLSTVLLAYLLAVVATSLVAGLTASLVAALEASMLANYSFVPPVGTFTIEQPENAFALLVFVLVAGIVATIVDRSRARAHEAAHRGAEADVLAALSVGVLRRENGVRAVLEQACETFHMRSASLFEQRDGRHATVIEVFGEAPPPTPEEAAAVVDAGPGLVLALAGAPLAAADLGLLRAFAAQTAFVLERARLAVEAADAERLHQTEAARNAMLAAVSHDLRTPLAGIRATIATLCDPALDLGESDRLALLKDAGANVNRLDSLVANLLDLSRIQSKALRVRMEPVALDEVLQRALHGVPDSRITDETDDSLPLISTDAVLMERCLANLVENAVRYAPNDVPVRLSAAVVPGGLLQLRVIDRGPGVRESDRERMFTPFQRLGDVPLGNGVGLGLAVARGLADAVGATLEAEDTPGGGLTMVVNLPIASQNQSELT